MNKWIQKKSSREINLEKNTWMALKEFREKFLKGPGRESLKESMNEIREKTHKGILR